MTLILPDLLWHQGTLQKGFAVEWDGSGVTGLRLAEPDDRADACPHILMPACTDLQVNGSGGVMLNSDPSPEALAAIVTAQRARGTGWVLPTLITTTLDLMEQAADAVIAAWGMPGLLGLHFEGPYLSLARKGTHRAAFIRPFEPDMIPILARLREAGIPVMLTLAPECVPAQTIARLHDMGVVLSAGHTDATAEEARAGLAAGVSCFTHLYNAMPQMQSRAPGVIAAAIGSEAYAGIIADGHHVAWEMIALACRARPRPRRMFLVSDAMATIGGPDHFTLYGERIELRDGKLVNADGALAGAHVDMVTSLRHLIRDVGLDPEEAIAMASDTPHQAMGLPAPQIAPGRHRAECLALDADLRPIALPG
ncbi:N-acetylglucosamine-6-phosphate deacetylase [Jiella mangrovi]|uniref:N-acetylglucosamine-6-phosphate deacetylase n=1 Tax=Jiella mangrovi TaxID=2821407 RepID=A0ABS4BGZ4_9HYPH|nr:N-acetylglucosamine-6-phosphate deacetylase [Jiella mangrovi]MBP0615817.1 N-acetylglucosamine-6-phosphate deacetylase [Jiella mangrovi]